MSTNGPGPASEVWRHDAARFLSGIDGGWAALVARIGPCGLAIRHEQEPYESLVRAIAFQQIHGRAAAAILARFLALYPDRSFPDPDSILATESSLMRGVGFSAGKISAIRAIAVAASEGVVPTRADAARFDDEALIERMVSIRGVGCWTVEMMLMHTLGRPDVWPVDDFGVREGWRVLNGLAKQPSPRQLLAEGLPLSPFRSAASWYLWRAADAARKPSAP
jgi:DNA-3-methyladenine glycosylase II